MRYFTLIFNFDDKNIKWSYTINVSTLGQISRPLDLPERKPLGKEKEDKTQNRNLP